MEMESKYGIRDGLWLADESVQCPDCKRWFESESINLIIRVLLQSPLQDVIIDGCRIIMVSQLIEKEK